MASKNSKHDGNGSRPGPGVDVPVTALARLGSGLQAVRRRRGLSQADIARLAEVTPSAISQAERAQRGLSLETLITLTTRLGIGLDELLSDTPASSYLLGRAPEQLRETRGRMLPLINDARVGLIVQLLVLPVKASIRPGLEHKDTEAVLVGAGSVEFTMPDDRVILHEGEVLVPHETTPSVWRNVGDDEALLFWLRVR